MANPTRRTHAALGPEARTAARLVAGACVILFASTALYVTAFHAPRAKGVDIGTVGTPVQAARVQGRLDAGNPGGFDIRRYQTEGEARDALLHTDVLGVLVAGRRTSRILVARALGAAPTDAVTATLRKVAARSRTTAVVKDVRALPRNDGRGLSPLFTVIGTLIPSLAFGVLLSVFGRRLSIGLRWTAIGAFALLAGLVVALNVDSIIGALDGPFFGIALVGGLLALAASAAAHGLGRLGGPPGIAAALLTLLLVGLSASGGAVGYQFEPGFYGAVSQLLPPGAAVTAVRNVVYFDWAQTLAPMATLGAWAAAGLALGLLGERYGPQVRRVPA